MRHAINPKLSVLALIIYPLIIYLMISGCRHYNRNKYGENISQSQIEKGEILAHKYCQSCHLFPDPSLLNAEKWETGVLPRMAPHLGIFRFKTQFYPSFRNDPYLSESYYPSRPLVSPDEWEAIMDYYVATSPDSLPAQNRGAKIKKDLSLFTVLTPASNYNNPATCFVKIDTTSKNQDRILIADAFSKKLFRFDNNLKAADSLSSDGAIVDLDFQGDNAIACNIGMLKPNNGRFGKGEMISFKEAGKFIDIPHLLFDSLQRPVQITAADINTDGKIDFLVCEFGFATGALSWMENTGNNTFRKHLISPLPGAIKVWIEDHNHDSLPDLWALFAQGEEGIFLFTNKGDGTFSSDEVLRFPPIYGSSYFEMDDFNKDGYPDILYTCGDNADYSTVLKPYHGAYIFLNDGKDHFTQKYFFPMNGCFKAMARDFDGDGDLDIAAISFFADYTRQPEEGFVYLENKGNLEFQPHTLPEAESGRWLTMDAGDFDGDGKPDIILGNFSVAPSFVEHSTDWEKGPPFLLLKNIRK